MHSLDVNGDYWRSLADDVDVTSVPSAHLALLQPPHVDTAAGVEAPLVRTRLLLVDRPGGTEVATVDGQQPIRHVVKMAGAYRVEQSPDGTASEQCLESRYPGS